MGRIKTHPTPNPNSLKFTRSSSPFIDSGMESFANAAEAAEHPLGRPLFELPGVANVFILPDFLTITKTPEASWDPIVSGAKAVLND